MSEKVDKLGRTGKSIGGRPKGSLSKRSIRQNRLKEVLTLIDPILAKAVLKAGQILDADLSSKDVSATTQLQAAKLIIDKAIDLREAVFAKEKDQLDDPEEDEQAKEVVPTQARFSTKVVSITKSDE